MSGKRILNQNSRQKNTQDRKLGAASYPNLVICMAAVE